jgi:hypothetical protein
MEMTTGTKESMVVHFVDEIGLKKVFPHMKLSCLYYSTDASDIKDPPKPSNNDDGDDGDDDGDDDGGDDEDDDDDDDE